MLKKAMMKMDIKNIMIKAEVKRFGFFIGVALLSISCNNNTLSGNKVVRNSIETHGGYEQWEALKQLSFNKETTLFYEDGSVETHTNQYQMFNFKNGLSGTIVWQDSEQKKHQILFDDGNITKTVNDTMVTSIEELKRAENSFWAAYYVASKPFDLVDQPVNLDLIRTIDYNGKKCYEVALNYKNSSDENGDHWFYIIDTETYEVLANKVVLKDHTSWIDNLTFDESTPFKFNSHRKSYRLNDEGEKTYLRAEYYYKDFKVLF
ncbi:MAG: hypothetical protein KC469_01370 [Flavobacteriaceae bacterium]|nr:hypothetical protein [Flavobacteriaceae bacterium]